jgi:hypothetical protein
MCDPESELCEQEIIRLYETADRIRGVPPGENQSRGNEWRQVRLFISSTFRDMHPERSFLVYRTLKELGAFCKDLRLHLLVCDLRWGVKPGTSAEVTIRTCLGEVSTDTMQITATPVYSFACRSFAVGQGKVGKWISVLSISWW